MSRTLYRNPVLAADWSDPDVIRVGDDFWMTASSFHRVPGLPLLHSRDLVNWSLVGHALPRLGPAFDTPQLGGGVWAPAIRHHAGLFWIFYPDPDRGIFVVTAADPRGPWSAPRLVKEGRGLIDPCPLWAADGTAYLVHAWAKSRAGINNRLTAHRMAPDASALLSEPSVIIDGALIEGCRTLEGPKAYEHDGYYWIFAPAGGVADGYQLAFRSRSFLGPYEHRTVLARGDTDVNGPHQGAWVSTKEETDWFLHFQDRGALGRVVHLQPMRWDADGWPVLGEGGAPVAAHGVPLDAGAAAAPATSDDFAGDGPGPQWTWQANPAPEWHEMLRPGLRLFAAEDPGDLRRLPTVLGQRIVAPSILSTTVRLGGARRAGLTILGRGYAWIGLAGSHLVCRAADPPTPGSAGVGGFDAAAGAGPERDLAPPVEATETVVTVHIGADLTVRFAFPGGDIAYTALPGHWIGATVGLFAAGGPGHADFGPFTVHTA